MAFDNGERREHTSKVQKSTTLSFHGISSLQKEEGTTRCLSKK
jgi:hypothetical protein